VEPLIVSLRASLHALRLTGRALARKGAWLLAAPVVWSLLQLLGPVFSGAGMLGGFLHGFAVAAALSLVMFVGRGVIEQRRMGMDDLLPGLGAFFGDVLNVLFVGWLASLVAAVFPPAAFALVAAVLLLPLFETVALSPVAGFGAFGSAWWFVRRDALAWFVGQWPAVLMGAAGYVLEGRLLGLFVVAGLPWRLAGMLSSAVLAVGLFAAFMYRGVLYLTLDATAPHARRRRFGRRET
jgi:hypothetical protein